MIHVPLYDDPDHSAESPEELFLKKGRDSQLFQAMERLKPEYRQVLWLSYFEGFDRREIAAILKKSVNSVDVLLHRAKAALRTEWEKEGFDR